MANAPHSCSKELDFRARIGYTTDLPAGWSCCELIRGSRTRPCPALRWRRFCGGFLWPVAVLPLLSEQDPRIFENIDWSPDEEEKEFLLGAAVLLLLSCLDELSFPWFFKNQFNKGSREVRESTEALLGTSGRQEGR